MKPDDILDAIGQVDDECIENAKAKPKTDKKIWITATSLAACLCIVAASVFVLHDFEAFKANEERTSGNTSGIIGTYTQPTTAETSSNTFVLETAAQTASQTADQTVSQTHETEQQTQIHLPNYWADTRERDKSKVVYSNMSAREWPWNCKEVFEQFTFVEYNGGTYIIRSRNSLSKDKVGKKLGTATLRGYDIYEDKNHTLNCSIYEIKCIDSSRFIAVKYQGHDGYYVFNMRDYDPPATLGDLISALNLTETFPLTSIYHNSKLYGLNEADSEALWNIFLRYSDAETLETELIDDGKELLAFGIFSEELGAENLSWALYDNGYIKTNIESYGYRYYIGKDAVNEIVEYALKHKTGIIEDNTQYLIGNVTEIGEDYIKVNDSVMMKNPDDGIEFTVMANDMRVKRYIISGFLKKGQLVRIEHTGIYSGETPIIETATNLEEVMLSENNGIMINF